MRIQEKILKKSIHKLMPNTLKKSWYPNIEYRGLANNKFSGSPQPKSMSGIAYQKKGSLALLTKFMDKDREFISQFAGGGEAPVDKGSNAIPADELIDHEDIQRSNRSALRSGAFSIRDPNSQARPNRMRFASMSNAGHGQAMNNAMDHKHGSSDNSGRLENRPSRLDMDAHMHGSNSDDEDSDLCTPWNTKNRKDTKN